MNTDTRSLTLERGEIMSFNGPAGHVISVRAGSLWITQEGNYADYIVEAGGTFIVRSGGVTLASALTSSVLEVRASSPRRAFESASVVHLNPT
jgi:hypothetical protein